MAKKERYAELAKAVLEQVGGKENITFFTHCMTRLRFNLKDKSVVDLDAIKKIEGVLGAQWSNEQLQIVIGQAVGDAYKLICDLAGMQKQAAVDEDLDQTPAKKK